MKRFLKDIDRNLFIVAVILRSIKTLKGHYSKTLQDIKGQELKKFKEAY
jgi:hypothetical protein